MKIDQIHVVASEGLSVVVMSLPGKWLPCGAMKGYRCALQHESGLIYNYDPYGFAVVSPVLVKASSDSVPVLEPLIGEQDKITRLDFAFDSDTLTVSKVLEAQKRGNIVSMVEYRSAIYGPDHEPETLYWGRRDGSCVVRCYDKAKEQKLDGVRWTRIEYELHGNSARLGWDLYRSDKADCASFLASRFRVVNDGSNPARVRPICEWFANLVSGISRRFESIRKASTLESKLEFARKALSSVRLLCEVEGMVETVSKLLGLDLTLEQRKCLSLEDFLTSKTRPIPKSLRKAERSSIRARLRSLFQPQTAVRTFSNSPCPVPL